MQFWPEHPGKPQTELHMSEHTDPFEIWRIAKVLNVTGHRRNSWYEAMRRGEAPRPIPLGPKTVGWVSHEVLDYINRRIALRQLDTAA